MILQGNNREFGANQRESRPTPDLSTSRIKAGEIATRIRATLHERTLLLSGVALLGTLLVMAPTLRAETSAKQPDQTTVSNAQPSTAYNWIGVSLTSVPHALRDQLGDIIPSGQGVLVADVSPGSPAQSAGIERNDVLLSYDNQRLYSPAQLAGLIRSDKAGREVTLQVVKKGKSTEIKVKLGSHTPDTHAWAAPRDFSYPMAPKTLPFNVPNPSVPPASKMPSVPPTNGQTLAWDSFESVQVKTLPDGRYHAEISYKDDSDQTRNFTFEGKRDEIIAQINAQSDMPQAKKQALLNALNLSPEEMLRQPFGQLPGAPFDQPFFKGNPFDSPFFRQDPFNDPFFRRNIFDDPFFRDYFYRFKNPYQERMKNQPPMIPPGQVPFVDANPDKII